MKKLCTFLLALVLLTSAVSARGSGEIRTELDKLRNEESVLSSEGAKLEADMQAKDFQSKSTSAQKADLDRSIFLIQEQLENANAQIQQYQLLIAQEQSNLEQALEEQQEMHETYKLRLRAMEEAGPVSYWSVLFHASSFSDLLSRIDSIHEIAEADQRMLKQLKEKAQSIAQQRDQLAQEIKAQDQMKEQLRQLEESMETQRTAADRMLHTLQADKDALSDELAQNEEAQDTLRAEIARAQQEYEAALSAEEAARLAEANKHNLAGGGGTANAGAGGSSANTGFIAPVSGYTITDTYGWRIHPLHGDRRFHHGLDYAVPMNTPIVACAAGTVIATGYNKWNGYYVSVSHGNGYATTYCHMASFAVSNSQSVTQGQTLGYVGMSGWTSGPHCHLEVRVNGQEANPAQYIPA